MQRVQHLGVRPVTGRPYCVIFSYVIKLWEPGSRPIRAPSPCHTGANEGGCSQAQGSRSVWVGGATLTSRAICTGYRAGSTIPGDLDDDGQHVAEPEAVGRRDAHEVLDGVHDGLAHAERVVRVTRRLDDGRAAQDDVHRVLVAAGHLKRRGQSTIRGGEVAAKLWRTREPPWCWLTFMRIHQSPSIISWRGTPVSIS